MKIICDLCDRNVESTIKEDGIWICTECAVKYPRVERIDTSQVTEKVKITMKEK